jgi:heme exporter protein C
LIASAQASVRRSTGFMLAAMLLLPAVFIRALAFTPAEATQGEAQKIFYIHAPSAWVAFLAFGVVGICSVLYLVLKEPRLDRLAASSAEVGVIFTTAVLVTGPIWGRAIWGAWWTWDARLTSTLFLWFIYFGYQVLRSAVHEPGQRARFSAVLGILGALLVPFIHISVNLFRTLHPKPVVLKPEGPTLPGGMLATLLFAFVAFTIIYAAMLWQRYSRATLDDARDAARAEADDRA